MQICKSRHKVLAARWILLAALLSFTVAAAASTRAPTNASMKSAGEDSQPFAAAYYDTLVAATRSAREQLPAMAKAADAVAERLLAGGDLYIAAVREDFVSEGMVRSGGLMLLKEYSPTAQLAKKDAVIFSWSNASREEDLALARKLHATGAFVIGIGPKPQRGRELPESITAFLDSSTPVPTNVLRRLQNQTYPVVSLQNLTLLWTFTGELVSALTRRGKMPAMYQSVLVPGARERNLALRGMKFHQETAVPAIPAGQLGQGYLDGLGSIFAALRKGEVGAIDKAARACVKTRRDGHQVYAWLISHFPNHQPGAPGDPQLIHPLAQISGEVPQNKELQAALKPGDLFFFLGYYRRPTEAYEVARSSGAQILEVITGMGKPETEPPQPDYVINPHWPFGDAIVSVPNYDIKILPSSGIVQASIWWAIVGSMVADEQKSADIIRSIQFARVRPSSFEMGSNTGDGYQKPAHKVTLTQSFEIQTTEVTQAQWEAVMGSNPSEFPGERRPVENVTWDDAQAFISRLNAQRDGYVYRLPTEAEWEYACRANTKQEESSLDQVAWYLKNADKQTHTVAQKKPNAWGLYDAVGNVCEWVQDSYSDYSQAPATDPQGPSSGSGRVVRGCGWGGAPNICNCWFRDALAPIRRDGALGFRLARTPR